MDAEVEMGFGESGWGRVAVMRGGGGGVGRCWGRRWEDCGEEVGQFGCDVGGLEDWVAIAVPVEGALV